MVLDRDYLNNFIKSYVESNLTTPEHAKQIIDVAQIDPRITIQPCQSPLTANMPEQHNGRNINVKVVCPDKKPWQLFVPVKVQTMVPILVTTMRVNKGALLDNENMEITFKDRAKIRGTTLTNKVIVSGARTKRNLSKGSAITNKNTCFVCKGQPVSIIAKSSNFEIKSTGTALQDGSLGDIISVKNNRSKRIVRGQVNAINQVVINL